MLAAWLHNLSPFALRLWDDFGLRWYGLSYAAGFLVRPFGALVFGRIGDLVGRKYTFLVTIMVMGLATFAVGLLPTFATVGLLTMTARGTASVGARSRPASRKIPAPI